MIGPIPALVAEAAFWVLLVVGWVRRELGARGVVIFICLWLAGRLALSRSMAGASLVQSWTAAIDIVLVFIVYKGDVRLT